MKTYGWSGINFKKQRNTKFTQDLGGKRGKEKTQIKMNSWDKQKFGEGAATKAWRAVLSVGVSPYSKLDVKLVKFMYRVIPKSEGFSTKE